jgi:sugar O-acyltransferase (sialic acid O-acetyltransferase NeuD family)
VRYVLFAASCSHASELVETARRLGWELTAAVRNIPGAPIPPEVPAVTEAEALDGDLLEIPFAVPQTSPAQRRAAIADARRLGFAAAVTMVDPTAAVASTATCGDGTYVGAGAVIGAAARIGTGCLINRSCSIAHHVVLGDHVTMGPGVIVSGVCTIQAGAFLGAGAVLSPGITIGTGAVVGAGAVVIRDVEPETVVVGNPARVLPSTSSRTPANDG